MARDAAGEATAANTRGVRSPNGDAGSETAGNPPAGFADAAKPPGASGNNASPPRSVLGGDPTTI